MLVADLILYSILAWYLDRLYPGKNGQPASPLFFLKRTNDGNSRELQNLPERVSEFIEQTDMSALDDPSCFGVVNISNLSKEYSSGASGLSSLWTSVKTVRAVDCINLKLHRVNHI
jgi:hypothetical protein